MLSQEQTEALFKVLDESTTTLQAALSTSYLDAFVETGDNLLNGQVQVEDGRPDQETVAKLTDLYQQADWQSFDSETVRRAVQLAMLKAIRIDEIQANHQLTPDTIAYIMGYLVTRLEKGKSHLTLLDLTVGTGNLLTAVISQLKGVVTGKIDAYGVDNDDSMLAIAQTSSDLQRVPVELVHQDALERLLVPASDLIVADLPIGYYPVDDNAVNFHTAAKSGHTYVHHLLLEQAMNQLTPGGFGVFLVPSQLFQSEQAPNLLKWLPNNAYLQGLLNLPSELFANVNAQKAILILQKPGAGAKQVEQVMLGEFPSFKNQSAFQKFVAEIVQWEEQNLLTDRT
ncbi:MAG: class I SAM-dependent methyltransferase [Levilactobacillus sp.]|uniref:class I SAM-dependent methyltransferase n=1 Tax=Levilactobacillus sp. TaxID=2767919 RepID=UPI00258596F7|nr:class I SAM-dependent methyltransferase [Levilactobacillus sp.]MCH4124384.1 class I SAM-dependent methyltransferase [Levilactobacillus sp.]MCI1554578.1 class I SAM-dependent methyltransferase [Levilactobacillus sp.]MCI1599741.1 class I SAM-dependent methyltransferase [Levilactobacillus sp.]MCI1606435.1 class I SAM-dependent methyltransferase [Levilactobacillus sp.]